MKLVDVQGLSVQFADAPVLIDVSMTISAGEIVTLIGPNGAGKSSLVRAIIGVIKPSRGQVIKNSNLRIGYVPQKLETLRTMPMSVARFLKGAGSVSPSRQQEIINEYGIETMLNKPLDRLSGGEMRRVLFAHALLDAPNLLILDEPTAGLDIAATARFYEYIERLRDEEKMAILLVSHDLNVVMRASDHVICLNGHVCCEGAPKDVSKTPEYVSTMGVFDPVALYEHHHDHTHEH